MLLGGQLEIDPLLAAGVVLVGLVVGLFEVGPTLIALGLFVAMFVLAVRFAVRRTRRLTVRVDQG